MKDIEEKKKPKRRAKVVETLLDHVERKGSQKRKRKWRAVLLWILKLPLHVYRFIARVTRVVYTLLGFFLIGAIIFVIVAAGGDIKNLFTRVRDDGISELQKRELVFESTEGANVIIIEPSGVIAEDYFPPLSRWMATPKNTKLQDITTVLKHIEKNEVVKAIIFDFRNLFFINDTTQFSVMRSLRDIKKAGKIVISYDSIRHNTYMASSVGNAFVIDILDTHILTGYTTGVQLYWKDFFERFGIDAHVQRVGRYKNFAENLVRNEMSKEARENIEEVYGELWSSYINNVAENRDIPASNIHRYINTFDTLLEKNSSAHAAIKLELATHGYDGTTSETDYLFEVTSTLTELNEEELSYQSFEDYMKTEISNEDRNDNKNEASIGVIPLYGEIGNGFSSHNTIGAGSIIPLLEEIKENENIQAIVLRLETPGGDARASERIHRALLNLKNRNGTKIPIVVSMGSLNTSGGYYIATSADYLIAEPFTITGSIGTLSVQLSINEALKRQKIYTDSYTSTWLDTTSIFEPSDERKLALTNSVLKSFYNQFLRHVAVARNMSLEEADAVAQGRIFTASASMNNGLIDEVGYLDDAIKKAAYMANISEETVIYFLPDIDIGRGWSLYLQNTAKRWIKKGIETILKRTGNGAARM